MFLDSEEWTRGESWIRGRLLATGLPWTRQPMRFWQRTLGIAVQLESADRDRHDDAASDRAELFHRGVMVIRVEEFNDEQAEEAIRAIRFAESWNSRRRAVGLPLVQEQRSRTKGKRSCLRSEEVVADADAEW